MSHMHIRHKYIDTQIIRIIIFPGEITVDISKT